jgi:hypothetical protein
MAQPLVASPQNLRSSLYSMSANVMRTALTMLGIIIGIGVVATAREKLARSATNNRSGR